MIWFLLSGLRVYDKILLECFSVIGKITKLAPKHKEIKCQ